MKVAFGENVVPVYLSFGPTDLTADKESLPFVGGGVETTSIMSVGYTAMKRAINDAKAVQGNLFDVIDAQRQAEDLSGVLDEWEGLTRTLRIDLLVGATVEYIGPAAQVMYRFISNAMEAAAPTEPGGLPGLWSRVEFVDPPVPQTGN